MGDGGGGGDGGDGMCGTGGASGGGAPGGGLRCENNACMMPEGCCCCLLAAEPVGPALDKWMTNAPTTAPSATAPSKRTAKTRVRPPLSNAVAERSVLSKSNSEVGTRVARLGRPCLRNSDFDAVRPSSGGVARARLEDEEADRSAAFFARVSGRSHSSSSSIPFARMVCSQGGCQRTGERASGAVQAARRAPTHNTRTHAHTHTRNASKNAQSTTVEKDDQRRN